MSLSLIFLALFLLLDDWMRSDDPPPLVIQASACAVHQPPLMRKPNSNYDYHLELRRRVDGGIV